MGDVIVYAFPDLWTYSFVHQWQKPEQLPSAVFEAEALLFRKSYELPGSFRENKEALAEELEEMGSFGSFIIGYAENPPEPAGDLDLEQMMANLRELMEGTKNASKAPPKMAPQSITPRTEPKTGRNDPCPCGSGKKYKKCCGR